MNAQKAITVLQELKQPMKLHEQLVLIIISLNSLLQVNDLFALLDTIVKLDLLNQLFVQLEHMLMLQDLKLPMIQRV